MEKLRVDLTKAIKLLEIVTEELSTAGVTGQYKSVFKGKGVEFDGYRVYAPDDDMSLIDWKASTRAKQLVVKEFVEERNINIFFLIDVSSSMVFGSTDKLKNEYAAEIVASLSHVALEAGDKIGAALFSDKIIKNIPPSSSSNQFYILSRTLVNPTFYGGGYNIGEALKFLNNYLKEMSIVMVISDFIGLKEGWERYLGIAGKKFDVIGMMVRDPRDRSLPSDNTNMYLADPLSKREMMVNPQLISREYKEHVKKEEEKIKAVFLSSGCSFINMSTDKPFATSIINFFKRRQRRAR
jgi:uncharacterized protein (DUF58 family)|tara:strand:+ start:241 stop:1128 length:888 start_codon:yes stop_codon:yes gene_type:complete